MIKPKIQLASVLTVLLLIISNSNLVTAQSTADLIIDQSATAEQQEVFPENIFPDVGQGNEYYLAIKYLKDKQLIQGYSDGLFRPDQKINRAEALKILSETIQFHQFSPVEKPLNTSIAKTSPACKFPDVSTTDWYNSYVCEAFNNHVIAGYPDGTFKPAQTINTVESLKIAILHSGIPIPATITDNFSNIDNSSWFAPYTSLAKINTFLVEDSNGQIKPGENLTRAEFSLLIYRMIQNRISQATFGEATYYAFSLNGHGTASGEIFNVSDLTAAHLTLPFGTIVQVKNLKNGKSVIVRINDRGPYVDGHIIDLSPTAFKQISTLGAGVTDVELILQN
jgi:rare lipoprotein A